MERAAETGVVVGQAARIRSAAALEALGWYWGRTHRLGLDDDLGWRACRRDGKAGWVTAISPAGLHAWLASDCGFVPPARAGGGGLHGGDTASGPGRDELTARVFRALYGTYDPHSVGDVHVVVRRGTPWFSGPSLGDVARQISDHEQRRAGRAE
jgi:hypothetical protein